MPRHPGDELLTALITEAYDSLGAAVERAAGAELAGVLDGPPAV